MLNSGPRLSVNQSVMMESPLGSHIDSASPEEVTLVEKTLENIRVHDGRKGRPRTGPKRLIADKGYDSDPLDATLRARYGKQQAVAATVAAASEPGDAILIAPHFYHWTWAYYAPRAGLSAAAIGIVVGAPPPPDAPWIEAVDRGLQLVPPEGLAATLEGHERAWLLFYKRRGGDPGGILGRLAKLGRLETRARFEGPWDRGELELFLWHRPQSRSARSVRAGGSRDAQRSVHGHEIGTRSG